MEFKNKEYFILRTTVNLNNSFNFTDTTINGIMSLYLSCYKRFLHSTNALCQFQPFIDTSRKNLLNYINKANKIEKELLENILENINIMSDLRNTYNNRPIIDLDKLLILLDTHESNINISNFIVPFICITNNRKNDILKYDLPFYCIPYIYLDESTDSIAFHFCNTNTKKISIDLDGISSPNVFLDFVFLFKFNNNNLLYIDFVNHFSCFNIPYFPDLKDNIGLGINKFTIFDLISGRFLNKKIYNERIMYVNQLKDYINHYNLIFSNSENDYCYLNVNLNSFSINKSTEAVEEEADIEEDPIDSETNSDTDLSEEETIEESNEEEPSEIEEELPDENDENIDNKEDNDIEEKKKEKPILNFKLEFANEYETIEDLIFKRFAYNHIRNLLIQDLDSNIISTMKIMMNQWFFLLSVKTIKQIVKNLESLVKTNKGD